MASVKVIGKAVVVYSSQKLEDLKTIKKYRPKALTLMGGENNKEPLFTIDVGSGNGSINQYGAAFASESNDENKLATITMLMDEGFSGDIKEFVADKFGGALVSLNKLEETLPAVLEEITTEKAAVMEAIEVN